MAQVKEIPQDSELILISRDELKDIIREIIRENRLLESDVTNDNAIVPKNVANTLPGMGVSETTLRRWDMSGYLPKVRIGQRVGYRKSDLKRIGVL